MKDSNGNSNQKSISRTFPISKINSAVEVLALFLLGAIAVVLHIKMRIPLKLPGHHGVEFMALIMLGRSFSKIPIASTISSLGIGMMMFFPIWAGKDPFAGAVYMIPGFAIDFLYYQFRNNKRIFITAILGGLSYGLIPVARYIIMSITGFPYEALLTGLAYPFLSFTFFGFTGSSIALLINKQVTKKKKE